MRSNFQPCAANEQVENSAPFREIAFHHSGWLHKARINIFATRFFNYTPDVAKIHMQDFAFYFPWGWKHIISWGALDHQLFIAALSAIYVLKDWRQVLILVTAFTIGHSLTLALSVYGIIPDRTKWIEFLIPCTIIVTAISNLFQKKFTPKSIRINYFLALFFGLIHGMGFASAIRITLATGQNIGWGLLGFNLGLEAGQIVIVIILLVLSQIIQTILKTNRREWVIFLSAAVFSLAVEMAIQRIPFKS